MNIILCFTKYRGVFRFLKPGWLRGENVVQVKHFDACTLYFLKNRGGQNHPNHPGNYTSDSNLSVELLLWLVFPCNSKMSVNFKSVYRQKPKFAYKQYLIICNVSHQMPPKCNFLIASCLGGL